MKRWDLNDVYSSKGVQSIKLNMYCVGYDDAAIEGVYKYRDALLKRLIPNLDVLPSAKESETYLAITELADQILDDIEMRKTTEQRKRAREQNIPMNY